jgi:hypothetical protein
VVNCSKGYFNLGACTLADWLGAQGYDVDYFDGDPGLFALEADVVALSVIFSWHAPVARQIALRMKDRSAVWCGGPGMFALAKWWQRETGLECATGLDLRFERPYAVGKTISGTLAPCVAAMRAIHVRAWLREAELAEVVQAWQAAHGEEEES